MSEDKTLVVEPGPETTTNLGNRSSPVLIQYDGGAPGKKFQLNQRSVVLGRRPEKVQVWIDDASVSREHCRIDFDGTRAVVTDLGSLNHTYVNDKIVMQSAEVGHGDMLRVGNVRLRYFAHGSADQLLLDRIYRMAVQDKVLEIFRRDYLLEKLEEEFRLARSNGTMLALIFFDLDKFKNINDTYGHVAGDFVLKEVCKCLKPQVLVGEVFGRYGGEEFCIILPQTNLDDAFNRAETMRIIIQENKVDYDGTIIPVTISAGVATITPTMQTAQDLVKATDTCVYASKAGGRNRVSRPPA